MTDLKNITDTDLTLLVKRGLKGAYQELFERYAPRVYHFSISYLKNEADAEELVQDVFLKIWESHESLDHSKNVKAYIFKVAVNIIYDFIRRKNIEHAFLDFYRRNGSDVAQTTWDTLIWEDMVSHLDDLVSRMPPQRRKIFRLSREKGHSNDEIAKKMNLSKRTVENQLYRALTYLKKNFNADSFVALLFLFLWCG